MGFSISWLAIRNKPAEVILSELGLRRTGKREVVPEMPVCGADLPGGWFLIWANACDYVDRLPLQRLSSGAEIMTCIVEEHVMFSSASAWNDGRQIWSVSHNAQQGIGHLQVEGEPPPAFADIRERLMAEQRRAEAEARDVDYIFDIPVEMARAMTGFRYDEDNAVDEEPFETLV